MIQNISRLSASSPVTAIPSLQPSKYNQQTKPESRFSSEAVILSISPEARQLLGEDETSQNKSAGNSEVKNKPQPDKNGPKPKTSSYPTSEISPEEERLLQKLKQSDLDVKIHEQQHIAAAGGYVKNGPVYEYSTGPDGKRYAVGGHVALDMSSIPNNPEATIRKAQVIKRAALAPADPSGADRSVAAAAGKMELKAREQLRSEQEKNMKIAISKGQNSKVAVYTKSHLQSGQTVNFLI